MPFARSFALGVVVAAAFQVPALADAPKSLHAETRLGHCGEKTCLVVTGHRVDAAAPVMLAGNDVAVQGAHSWRVAVPLATVQAWSAPFARTIAVHVGGPGGGDVAARLPTGLLGHVADLAFLDVRASH